MIDLFEEDDFDKKLTIKPGFDEEQDICTFVDGVQEFDMDPDNLQETLQHINKFIMHTDDSNKDIVLIIDIVQIIDHTMEVKMDNITIKIGKMCK